MFIDTTMNLRICAPAERHGSVHATEIGYVSLWSEEESFVVARSINIASLF
jgi:hypothetical protein